jgi:hypothetical protein
MVNYSEVYNQIHANLHEGDYWTATLQFASGINENGSIVTSKLVDLVPLLQPNQMFQWQLQAYSNYPPKTCIHFPTNPQTLQERVWLQDNVLLTNYEQYKIACVQSEKDKC